MKRNFFGWPWPCTKQIPPELFRDAKTLQNEVLYDSLWLLFAKLWFFYFSIAAILAAISNLLNRRGLGLNFLGLRPQVGSPSSLLLPGQKDRRAAGIDALVQPWNFSRMYAFLPHQLILLVLATMKEIKGVLMLVTPSWTRSVWLPELQCSDVFASFQLIGLHPHRYIDGWNLEPCWPPL